MHVVMVIANYLTKVGGMEKQCALLSEELVKKGCDCTVLTYRRHKGLCRGETVGGVYIRRLNFLAPLIREPSALKQKFYVGALGAHEQRRISLRERLSICVFMLSLFLWFIKYARKIDVVHVHSTEWLAGYLALLGQLFNKPVLVKEATYPALAPYPRGTPQRRLLNRYRNRAHFIAVNEVVKDDLNQQGIPLDRIKVLSNGVLLSSILENKADPNKILYVGNLSQGDEAKDFTFLFKAWSIFSARHPDVKLLVAGKGDVTAWRSALESEGCGDSVEFLGLVEPITDYYRSCNFLLLSSKREGMPNVVLEAMACGLPVVCRDIPATRVLITHKKNGMLTPLDDLEGFVESMNELYAHEALRSSISAEAHLTIKEGYAIDIVGAAYIQHYQELKNSD